MNNSEKFFLWLISGATGSGKTYEMIRILTNPKYGMLQDKFDLDSVYIFSKHFYDDDSQEILNKYFDKYNE